MNTLNLLVFLVGLMLFGWLNNKYRFLAPRKPTPGLAQTVEAVRQFGHDVENGRRAYAADTEALLKDASMQDLRDLGEALLELQAKAAEFDRLYRDDVAALEDKTSIPVGLPDRPTVAVNGKRS